MKTGGFKKIETPKTFMIYLWQEKDKYYGASPVMTIDGIKEVYCHAWEIEKDPLAKRNEQKHQAWRAKIKVKNLLNNTLNVLNWYGKKALGPDGNIHTEKLRELEARAAMQSFKEAQKTGKDIDISDLYPIKKFPTKEITPQKAREFKFI